MVVKEETKQYWNDQLSEYWESGFTIREYCELKDVSYEIWNFTAFHGSFAQSRDHQEMESAGNRGIDVPVAADLIHKIEEVFLL